MYVITAQQTEPRHEKTPPAEASGASTRRTKSSGVVVPVVPNPRHGKLLALLDVTGGKLVNPAKKNPPLSIQQQERVSESSQAEANALVLCLARWRKRRIT